jgi:hypothetical protein
MQVFEDFTYHRQLASDDGLNVVLEFSARVGDKQLKGIDLVRFDEAGKIVGVRGDGAPLERLAGAGCGDGRAPGGAHAGFQGEGVTLRSGLRVA